MRNKVETRLAEREREILNMSLNLQSGNNNYYNSNWDDTKITMTFWYHKKSSQKYNVSFYISKIKCL